ncbi:unnamed protein product, partial [Meganyctiphanes norvegica]|uniref:Store-operated calcium entry-associated regulatory factor n=1 Tax=Meganyctiphanes norvegica TaxID=48144 RepID=A0AAV2S6B7_MEGNR
MASCIGLLITSIIVLLLNDKLIMAWGGSDKVLLKDIDVLTLYNGKMTKGSRSSPVLQLECVEGGTAPCNAFKPRIVQCYNRGSDGADVQWECKTDMDNAYRFGEIEVSCEGYHYPDDPYILKGSCGLRYNIDYTKEGHQQKHDYYGDSQSENYYGSNGHNYYNKISSKSWNFADIIVLGAVGLMIYAFYITCIRPSHNIDDNANSTTNEDYPSGGGNGGGYGWHNPSAPPPPGSDGGAGGGGTYGFNPDYTDGASCGRNRSNFNSRSAFGGSGASGSGGGGFWTGAATGGLLGYMFGNRNNGNQRYGGSSTWGTHGSGGRWGSGGSSWRSGGGGFSGGASTSTGTRSASGFGGTSRR